MATKISPEDLFLPMLKTLTRGAWKAFKLEFEAYIIKGGQVPLRKLFNSTVLPVLKLRLKGVNPDLDLASEDTGDETLLEAIDQLWAPRSKSQALDRFRAISMRANPNLSEDPVVAYCSEYLRLDASTPAAMKPNARTVVREFTNGLKPAVLQDEVRATAPDSLDEAVTVAIETIEDMSRYAGKLFATNPGGRSSTHDADASPSLDKHKRSPDKGKVTPAAGAKHGDKPASSKVVTCHHCGEEGHIRPNCPTRPPPRGGRQVWIFYPAGRRCQTGDCCCCQGGAVRHN